MLFKFPGGSSSNILWIWAIVIFSVSRIKKWLEGKIVTSNVEDIAETKTYILKKVCYKKGIKMLEIC